jgi:hypothetical protein
MLELVYPVFEFRIPTLLPIGGGGTVTVGFMQSSQHGKNDVAIRIDLETFLFTTLSVLTIAWHTWLNSHKA